MKSVMQERLSIAWPLVLEGKLSKVEVMSKAGVSDGSVANMRRTLRILTEKGLTCLTWAEAKEAAKDLTPPKPNAPSPTLSERVSKLEEALRDNPFSIPAFMKARAFVTWQKVKLSEGQYQERVFALRSYCDLHSLYSPADASGKHPTFLWPLQALEAVFVDGWIE